MKQIKIFLVLLVLVSSIIPVDAGKVWIDGQIVYNSDTPPSILDSLRLRLATIAGGVTYQTYTGITRAFFGGGATDECTWTQENYRITYPTYYNQYPVSCGASKGYFYAQFGTSTGKETGQIISSSEQALFDYFDSVGTDYSSFYTRPVVSTPTPTPTPSPTQPPTQSPTPLPTVSLPQPTSPIPFTIPITTDLPLISALLILGIGSAGYFLIRKQK